MTLYKFREVMREWLAEHDVGVKVGHDDMRPLDNLIIDDLYIKLQTNSLPFRTGA